MVPGPGRPVYGCPLRPGRRGLPLALRYLQNDGGPLYLWHLLWGEFNDLPAWERKLVEGPYIHHMAEIEGDWTEVLREFCKFVPGLTADAVNK